MIADNVTDNAKNEQLALVQNCEPESSLIREDVVSFVECDSGVTGEALADKILEFVGLHLDPNKTRGQA